MDDNDLRLSRIETLWSVVREAHKGPRDNARNAQQRLMELYGPAIRRYLLGALRDPDAADEVFQEFSLSLVRGAFGRADPSHGRFRSFVKTSLYHLIIDHQRRRRCQAVHQKALAVDPAGPEAGPGELAGEEEALEKAWRDELLSRCWAKLSDEERDSGKPCYSALRFRLAHPDLRSPELAAQLGAQLGKPLTAGAVRVLIHRAREMFADLLLEVVCESLKDCTRDEVEQELSELNLLDYCRSALERREQGKRMEVGEEVGVRS
jgi:RNA polymerase sigma-70 factor (ECF subfamily)